MEHPKQILQRYGLHPKKSLGQNFLWNDDILARIVASAVLHDGRTPPLSASIPHVLEIGPGLGALTAHLARAVQSVTAVELDDRFIPILQQELAAYPNVDIVHADILTVDPAKLLGDTPYSVVANVPYYITGAILKHLLGGNHRPELLVLTVQKEVAERLAANPPNMSLLTVMTQLYGDVSYVHTLKAGSFWPRPDVDSAIVKIDLRQRSLPREQELLRRIVKAGFQQKRKQLKNNLRALHSDKAALATWLDDAGVDGRRRAETLTVDEWLALAASYSFLNLSL